MPSDEQLEAHAAHRRRIAENLNASVATIASAKEKPQPTHDKHRSTAEASRHGAWRGPHS